MDEFLASSQVENKEGIDWYHKTVCYCDSDGDLIGVSDDEDLACAVEYHK